MSKSAGCTYKCYVSQTQQSGLKNNKTMTTDEPKHTKRHYVRHGGTYTRLWGIYKAMMGRCYNPKTKGYKNYGGRGIDVCSEWKNNFKGFQDWALSHGYDENAPRGKCTIDRIDNNKGYSPQNCRFVDQKIQCRNQRKTMYLTIDGITKPLMEWAELPNAPRSAEMRWRKHNGWSDEEVVYGKK